MSNSKRERKRLKLNAGAMADISFLLLIFFLISTTMSTDMGISVQLPPWNTVNQTPDIVPKRNLLEVKINGKNELLVEGTIKSTKELSQITVEFLTNPQKLKTLPASPKKAVISLQNDRATEYEEYVKVYNELITGYHAVWEELALAKYGIAYTALNKFQKKRIRNEVPLVIIEAEPTEFALNELIH